MRLGEALIQKGLLTPAQLEKALNAQLIFGAHLGTCLLELGYVDEDSLGVILAELNGVPYAGRALLGNIPEHVIQMLAGPVAERRLAIPFAQEARQLRVAMVDPRHLPTLDELAFVSGCRIDAWVTPEVRVLQALEQYYGAMRRQRYVVLARQLDEMQSEMKQKGRALMAATIGGSPVPARERAREAPVPRWNAPVADLAIDWVAEVTQDQEVSSQSPWLATAADELCRADDIDRLGKIVIHHASKAMPRCALFLVRWSTASLWEERGFTGRRPSFDVTAEPVFTLPQGERYYKGAVPPEDRFQWFFREFGLSLPSEIFVAPVYLRDRIAAVFYGDSGERGTLQREPHEILTLLEKLSLTMGLLLIKRQIRLA